MATESVALVTGASGGLGREVARQLAERGVHVVIAPRDAAEAAQTAQELGVSALSVGLDIRARSVLSVRLSEVMRAADEDRPAEMERWAPSMTCWPPTRRTGSSSWTKISLDAPRAGLRS